MYINPSMQFAIALLVFHETLQPSMLLTFVLIWSGLAFDIHFDPAALDIAPKARSRRALKGGTS